MNKYAIKQLLKDGKVLTTEPLKNRLEKDELTKEDEELLQRFSDMPGLNIEDGQLTFDSSYARQRGIYLRYNGTLKAFNLGISYYDKLMHISLMFITLEIQF